MRILSVALNDVKLGVLSRQKQGRLSVCDVKVQWGISKPKSHGRMKEVRKEIFSKFSLYLT
jgi:hypothetical protein